MPSSRARHQRRPSADWRHPLYRSPDVLRSPRFHHTSIPSKLTSLCCYYVCAAAGTSTAGQAPPPHSAYPQEVQEGCIVTATQRALQGAGCRQCLRGVLGSSEGARGGNR